MQEVRENFLPIKENWTTNKYPPVKPGALWVNRSKRLAQTLGRLKAAGYLSRFN